jgi:hypothetical protein
MMNEAEAVGALANATIAASQQTQAVLLMLGGQIFHGILIGAGIIGVAILAHAVIHGLLVRKAGKQ